MVKHPLKSGTILDPQYHTCKSLGLMLSYLFRSSCVQNSIQKVQEESSWATAVRATPIESGCLQKIVESRDVIFDEFSVLTEVYATTPNQVPIRTLSVTAVSSEVALPSLFAGHFVPHVVSIPTADQPPLVVVQVDLVLTPRVESQQEMQLPPENTSDDPPPSNPLNHFSTVGDHGGK